MRSAGYRLAGYIGLMAALLLAGCYQNAAQPAREEVQRPSGVATFTPQPAGLPVVAEAEADEPPPPTATPEPDPPETDPLNLTATAMIARATQAQAGLIAADQADAPPAVSPAVPVATSVAVAQEETVAQAGADCIHVVQAGDRGLHTIAGLYGVDVAAIQRASGLANIELIHVGNELVIPGCGVTGFRQSTTPGESCEPSEWRHVHTVLAGENLFRIALLYGVDVNELALFNCIPDPALIRVGQKIYIR